MIIDTSTNFQKECGMHDADKYSKPLQQAHQYLWSKALPNGKIFHLACISQNRVYHTKDLLQQQNLSLDVYIAYAWSGYCMFIRYAQRLILPCQYFLNQPSASVDNRKPTGGTIALIQGLSFFIKYKYASTTKYVDRTMPSLRVQLVSHFLSSDTLLFRASIASMRSSKSFRSVME